MSVYANTSGPTTLRTAFSSLASKVAAVRLAAPFFSYAQVLEELSVKRRSIYLIVRLCEATSPSQLARAIALPNVQVRYFTSQLFHTKLYIFGDSCALVGSANLTQAGMQSNREAAVAVPSGHPDFDELVALFESYWSEAQVLDQDRLSTYRRIWRNTNERRSVSQIDKAVLDEFGDLAPSAGVQVDRPRLPGAKLYLEDYRRAYQAFLQAYREVEAHYAQAGQRKVERIPRRIEIDQFFNYVREVHCRGDAFVTAPLRSPEGRAVRLSELLSQWFETDLNRPGFAGDSNS